MRDALRPSRDTINPAINRASGVDPIAYLVHSCQNMNFLLDKWDGICTNGHSLYCSYFPLGHD